MSEEYSEKEFEQLIKDTAKEFSDSGGTFHYPKISKLANTKKVKTWPTDQKVAFCIYCMKDIHEYVSKIGVLDLGDERYREDRIKDAYVSLIVRSKLALDEAAITTLNKAFVTYKKHSSATPIMWPLTYYINQIIKQYKGQSLSPTLEESLVTFRKEINEKANSYQDKEKQKLMVKIDEILFESQNGETAVRPAYFAEEDEFGKYANAQLKALKSEDKKAIWYQLIIHAQKVSGGKPTAKFLSESKELIDGLGKDKFKLMVNDWILFVIQLKEVMKERVEEHFGRTYTFKDHEFIVGANIEALKGFVWSCSFFHDANTLQNISKLAERCYKKVPGHGPIAGSLGNACFYALYKSKGLDGIGQLSRLKAKIKQGNARKYINKYLVESAKEKGISVHEIEDLSIDDAGLVNGQRTDEFDDYKAVLSLVKAGKTTLEWIKLDGKLQKSVPAFVKEKYKDKLKRLKLIKKQIEQTSSTQRDRLDRMFKSDRKWSYENFESLYLNHGLMSFLAQKIIWSFTLGDQVQSGIYMEEQWVDENGQSFEVDPNSVVSLWHPANYSQDTIKTWRAFLEEREIQQPIKQAFREVYLLTEAEINTKSYSNRMAAHILKQHQYVNLAKVRTWKAALIGAWDGGDDDTAEIQLPEYDMVAQFWVQSVNAENEVNDSGIWNYISTDQVRFVNTRNTEIYDLVDVPRVIFSEVMRDVDLFVGVASVGNDATWQDSGGLPQYRDYWHSYSFGNLSEIAKNRKGILEKLVPRLKIRDVAEIKERYLVVKGKLRTYKIHIGSTNILMEPNDQYLCIVPDQSKKNPTEKIFIPFEGDRALSVILSKAFLLAADDKITDKTITTQIHQK